MTESRRMTLRPRVVNGVDADGDTNKEDNYVQKVVRYIPGEIVVAYTFAAGLVLSTPRIPTIPLLWAVIAVLGVLTPIWLFFATRIPDKLPPVYQIVVGTLAYLLWVFALAGSTLFTDWYNSVYGSLLLMLFTLVVPLVEKIFLPAGKK